MPMRKIFNAATLAVGAIVALGVVASAAQAAGEGEKDFKKYCSACHTTEPGKNKIGPSLHGVVGRKSGSIQNFQYSDAMKKSDLTWTDENLDKYLTNPKAFVPGNKMAFAGVKKEDERKEIIDFLNSQK
jgi:cytochrome c